MAHAILMPKPGQMTEECSIVEWHKQEGDLVTRATSCSRSRPTSPSWTWRPSTTGSCSRSSSRPASRCRSTASAPGSARRARPFRPPRRPAATLPVAATPLAAPCRPRPVDPRRPPRAPGWRSAPVRVGSRRRAESIPGRSRAPGPTAGSSSATCRCDRDPVRRAGDTRRGGPVSRRGGPPPDVPDPQGHRRAPDPELDGPPHFTVTVAVDVTRLLALRAQLKAAASSLTVTDLVLAAAADTLAEFPDVNSRTDGATVWPRSRVHLGMAVSLPAGLVVPLIRDADRLTLQQTHDRAAALATAARDGTASVDDLTGNTFTVSNLGMFGVEEFSAIINPGEAAILAVSSAAPTPVALDGAVEIRQVMKLTLSADHRLVDGAMGAQFLRALKGRLETADTFRFGAEAPAAAAPTRGRRLRDRAAPRGAGLVRRRRPWRRHRRLHRRLPRRPARPEGGARRRRQDRRDVPPPRLHFHQGDPRSRSSPTTCATGAATSASWPRA